jgi:2-polyprenyl-3-methyl-5-hydroxy-6-metoxy-1,4-benzoquinol methylase
MSEERVVPGQSGVLNLMRHVARYNLALQYSAGKRVLDAACGTGYGSKLLSMIAEDVVGWDNDGDTISHALKHFGSQNISYYCVDLEKLPDYKVSAVGGVKLFDTLVCFETLEHLEDPTLFLNRSIGLLNKDGLIIASVPLNEVAGQNEHHKQVYTLETASALFSMFNTVISMVQAGMSFYPAQVEFSRDPRTYYIFVGKVR